MKRGARDSSRLNSGGLHADVFFALLQHDVAGFGFQLLAHGRAAQALQVELLAVAGVKQAGDTLLVVRVLRLRRLAAQAELVQHLLFYRLHVVIHDVVLHAVLHYACGISHAVGADRFVAAVQQARQRAEREPAVLRGAVGRAAVAVVLLAQLRRRAAQLILPACRRCAACQQQRAEPHPQNSALCGFIHLNLVYVRPARDALLRQFC